MITSSLQGPGFFIFFRRKQREKQRIFPSGVPGKNRIKEEDEEILFFIQTIVTRGLI